MKLASFDIFDTTLLRKCGNPDNIFYLMAERLYPNDANKRNDFFNWRKGAETELSKLHKSEEITIKDIYTLSSVAKFVEYGSDQLIEIEKQIESENLTVFPFVKHIIDKKREEGYTACFISDMYLDSDFLKQILKREKCLLEGEDVFVSCEHNARKSNGLLYDIVKDKYNPDDWIHYGDNKHSDIEIAKSKGIKTIRIQSEFTEVENELNKPEKKEYSILSGLQRTVRLKFGNDSFNSFAADFVASAYIPYVHYLLENAKKKGIRRLYFLSRDSYILMKIAEQHKSYYTDIELKYLFVSRKSLTLPYLKDFDKESYLLIQDHNTLVGQSVDNLLSKFEITRQGILEKYRIEISYNKINTLAQESDFLNKIFNDCSQLTKDIIERINHKRNLLIKYFKQEGLFDDVKSAMVDVGWLGTSRLMINSILKSEGAGTVDFFYYGVRGDVLSENYGKFETYFNSNELSTDFTALVENYFSASPYPTTLGYSESGGKIVPVFPEKEGYKQTSITESNVKITESINKYILGLGIFSQDILRKWAIFSMQILQNLHCAIDLKPLESCNKFDDIPFVKHLSRKEKFKIIFLGAHVTAFDKASLYISSNKFLFKLNYNISNLTGRFRRYLYLKLKK